MSEYLPDIFPLTGNRQNPAMPVNFMQSMQAYGNPYAGFNPDGSMNLTGNALLNTTPMGIGTTTTPTAGGFDLRKFLIGSPDAPGVGGLALGTLAGVGNLFMGMKQYGLAKKSLDENKRQFELNYEAQKGLTNSQLADRQNARQAASPGYWDSTADYMARYGVK